MVDYDFSGWATKVNVRCSDGRTILKDAFKDNDGKKVPLIWNHKHDDPNAVLGHAVLENREEGVYAYCKFNDSPNGQTMKKAVQHGDIEALSIWANQLRENMSYVSHGNIREVSLVLAGANIGAMINNVIRHGEELDDEAVIYTGEGIYLFHSDEETSAEGIENEETVNEDGEETVETEEVIEHADKEGDKDVEDNKKEAPKGDKTIQEVLDSMTEEQQNVVNYLVGEALGEKEKDEVKHSEGGNDTMKKNLFENDSTETVGGAICHADQEAIISLAKQSNVGSLKMAMNIFAAENQLAHGMEDYEALFPEYKDVKPGAPELLHDDWTWVDRVIAKAHKSPISRIRTRQADARNINLAAMGYEKTGEKKFMGNVKLISRTTDPQTVYIKDKLERDDMIDITDFDVAAYQNQIMTKLLHEKIATAILIGDGLEDGTEGKISEDHIRSIWNDDELYTIHADVDIEAMKTKLQGTNTSANFGDEYIYAEAMIAAALYAREKYKGSGSLDYYCTPHSLNVMLLARDLNGRRIYDSKADLAAALNVKEIYTVEQFEGKKRKTSDGKEKKLLGIFVNMADYQIGATKGGQVTSFEDFDIDFNQYKYLKETRLSGANTRVFSAIALEEPVEVIGG